MPLCINAVGTYKYTSLVRHCFDTFQGFSLSLCGSHALIDDNKRGGEI